jgi:phage tail sheath protein FI
MLVTRVVTGSFSAATSSAMTALGVADDPTKLDDPFVLETLSEGEIMNNTAIPVGDTEIAGGAMLSGSQYNIRWEVPQVNTASGQFSLVIRRGDDRTAQQTVLEQYNNVSLDPQSSNYISKVIGDIDNTLGEDGGQYFVQESGSYTNRSRYVRVKQVNYKTPQYFNNAGVAKDEYTGSLPQVQSGSFGDATGKNVSTTRKMNFYEDINGTDSQGLTGPCYTNVINLLSNQDEYQYNIISAPGLINASTGHASEITALVNNSVARGDNMAVIDLVEYNAQIATVTDGAAGFDNSYTATYWPWIQTVDPNTGELVWIPASTMVPGVMAYTDASSEPWFAPAGITRGGLGQVTRAERKLTVSQRDTLYEANVNPIASFPNQGVVVFGQKTLQKRASALDRINVRRLLIQLKGYISQVADNLVFEQNTISTRNNFLTQVNPYLESVQQRQGLYAFKVVMDDSNNTPDVIDRNELLGQIFIQPTRTAEFVILDFNVLPTGATFPA